MSEDALLAGGGRVDANLSIAHGPVDVPLLEITIGQALRNAGRTWGGDLALVSRHQAIRWTWTELDTEVDRVATGLLRHGVAKGDRVGIWAPNCAEWAVIQYATARIGAILVNINPAYRVTEAEYALNKVGCSVLVTATAFKSSDYLAMLREFWPAQMPHLRLVVTLGEDSHDGCLHWAELRDPVDKAALAGAAAALSCHDPINIQFTSGTTGFPKGAALTHRNILNNGYFSGKGIGLAVHDRIAVPVPLYHCFGMVLANLAALTSGAAVVYPGEAFDPGAVLAAVAAERCTALYGVPTMFIAALNHSGLADYDLSSLRTGIMSGAPCPLATMREVIDRLHIPEITIGYGMTETSPLTTLTARDDPIADRVGSVGRPQPHAEAKIIGEDGEPVPHGVAGEYCSRGYSVMLGYWNEQQKTAEAIDRDGWMHSGDVATMDERGYVRITGRIKDMIIRGGENIYPREIEEYLLSHAHVADAQVFGVPDAKFGEEVCAWVIPKPGMTLTEEAVIAHCKGRIAHYKVPRYVRVVEVFAMTVTGKAQKLEMRRMMEQELAKPEVQPLYPE